MRNARDTQPLEESVQFLKGVGPVRAKHLKRLGIESVKDLLCYFPRKHEDRSAIRPISHTGFDAVETVRGKVFAVRESRVRANLSILKAAVSDGTGVVEAVWFNQPYLKQKIRKGVDLIMSGRVQRKFGRLQIENPEFEEVESEDEHNVHTARIVPIYGLTEGLSQKSLRSIMKNALDRYSPLVTDYLDDRLLFENSLVPYPQAIYQIHFPDSKSALESARRRLVWDELFAIQLGLALMKRSNQDVPKPHEHKPDGSELKRFVQDLPFSLTLAQSRVWAEISADMESPRPMSRLLQGDVGSGKTVVAAMALLKSVESGHQGALMAPTEILAEQHFLSLRQLFASSSARIALLTSSLSNRQRDLTLSALSAGEIDIIVGTHALIQPDVEYRSLGLAVVDEQHRFGVRQRAGLAEKGANPDMLVMTATPIPRTLALTLYGDLDYSVIDEIPPGRKPVTTQWIPENQKRRAYSFAREQVLAGGQVYVVCPLIEESENMQSEAATVLAERLKRQVFRGISVGLIHGRLSGEEREAVMRNFREKKMSVLVSTTVIEVGVDVPNASVMIIEGAERFGLAQLHQLRGRVGRGGQKSFCFLVTGSQSADAKRRMEVMVSTNDGFVIAEADLEIRGPGEFFGTRQHGLPDLKIANPLRDHSILLETRAAAAGLVASDPHLEEAAHSHIRARVLEMWPDGMGLLGIS